MASHLHHPPYSGEKEGKDPDASAAIVDSRSVKTTEECGKPGSGGYDAHGNGYDAHKNVKGKKRHLLVDTLGLPLSVHVTPADVQDRVGARLLLAGLAPLVPRLEKIWADGAYGGEPLSRWCRKEGGWDPEIVERDRETKGFEVIQKRWVVERTFSWIGRNRRMRRLRAQGADRRMSDENRDDPSGPRAAGRGGVNAAEPPNPTDHSRRSPRTP